MPQRGLCPCAAQTAAVGDWEPSWVPTDGSFPWLITQAALRGDILRPSRAYSAFSGLYSSFHYFSPIRVAKIRLICTLRKQKRWKSACCPDTESLSPLLLHILAEWEWTRSHLWLWHIRCPPEKHQVPHLPTGADHQPSQGIAAVPRPT